ncbi:MAG: hypothetical protein JW717_00385 [Marinilabiliaceae bacterium]|nr:hypothetical protein [Marinilabiliaceae bacterium]
MKRILFFIVVILFVNNVFGQVFGTASTLGKKQFALGFEPLFLQHNNDDFMFFMHGGYGLASGVDLGLKLGFLGDQNYIGADLEFAVKKRFSLAVGFHDFYDLGMDGTALYTFPITSGASLSTGLDMDVVMTDPETIVPIWVPVCLEIAIKRGMVFILEGGIDTKLIDESYSYFGGGLQFFF